jgi:hypothetical protein
MSIRGVKKGVVVFFIFIILCVSCLKMALAFGISTPYLEDNTLKVSASKSYNYTITIQNGDTQGYDIDINYSSEDDIVRLGENTFYVPPNTYNTTVTFIIQIPEDAKIGEAYDFKFSVKPRTDNVEYDAARPLAIGIELKKSLKIIVGSEGANDAAGQKSGDGDSKDGPISSNFGKYLLTALIALIIIVLAIFVTKRMWNISDRMSTKISKDNTTKYTISQAINISEVIVLLEKISNEEFKVSEIRNLFKDKIMELSGGNSEIIQDISQMSRKKLIHALHNMTKKSA